MSFNPKKEEYDGSDESRGTYYGFDFFKDIDRIQSFQVPYATRFDRSSPDEKAFYSINADASLKAFQNPWLLNHSGIAANDWSQYFDLYQNLRDQNKQPWDHNGKFGNHFQVDKAQHFPQIFAGINNMPPLMVHPSENSNNNGHGDDTPGNDLVEDKNDCAHNVSVTAKGHWNSNEDRCLKQMVGSFGEKKWSYIAKSFQSRTGKQCRERWHNHLRPDIMEKSWTEEEENILIQAHAQYGNKWVQIATFIPGRSENAIKNHWNTNKRKNFSQRNSRSRRLRPRTAFQEYIASVVQNGAQEGNNNAPNQAQPEILEPEEEMVHDNADLNLSLNQVLAHQSEPEEEEMVHTTGANLNLSLNQVLALNSDEINPVGTFTELLGLNINNVYEPEFVPSGRYSFSRSVDLTYCGGDVGCSYWYGAPSEPTEDYNNMAFMSSEKANYGDVKGKAKMFF